MAPTATTRERPFGDDEPFACVVDRSGRLVAVDPVFERLSGAGPGGAFDALRHPELADAVLRGLFGPVGVAHVRLVAADGATFRAALAAAPVASGWAVVGFKPTLPDVGRALQVRAAELAGDDLAPRLAEYEPAMRVAFVAEAAARGPLMPTRAAPLEVRRVAALLEALGQRLADYQGSAEALRRTSGLEELAESIRLFALNAILAAHRVRDAAAIGAVAGLMKTRSDAAGPDILALGGEMDAVVAALEAVRLQCARARIQAEALGGAPWLAEALAGTLEAVAEALTGLDRALEAFAARLRAVEEHLKTLRFLELQGRIEAARADDTEHVRGLFADIGVQVRTTGDELKALASLATRRVGSDLVREARGLAVAFRTSQSGWQTSHRLR